jgi:hypothetical protein
VASFSKALFGGRLALINPAAGVIGLKLLIDFAFYLWSINLYRRRAAPTRSISFEAGLLAALIEPFSFQVLRHLGAAWGWVVFLTGERTWGTQHRSGLTAMTAEVQQDGHD